MAGGAELAGAKDWGGVDHSGRVGVHSSARVRGLACTGQVSCGRARGMVSSAPVLTPIGRRS
jgi:hypothetical protein